MSAHTPGPWLIDNDDGDLSIYVPSENGLRYVIARDIGGEVYKDAFGKFTDYSTVDANASMIAAAPRLLAIAERWAALDGGSWHVQRHANEKAELLAETIAAIAAATGETK